MTIQIPQAAELNTVSQDVAEGEFELRVLTDDEWADRDLLVLRGLLTAQARQQARDTHRWHAV